jgi:DNA-directed RNA polymerase subunit RPC12/RpoP
MDTRFQKELSCLNREKSQGKAITGGLDREGGMFYSRRTRSEGNSAGERGIALAVRKQRVGLAPLVSLIPSGLWEFRSMGRYCGKCGREVQAVIYAGEAVSPAPVYRCPHCGPNVPVVGSPVGGRVSEGPPVLLSRWCGWCGGGLTVVNLDPLEIRCVGSCGRTLPGNEASYAVSPGTQGGVGFRPQDQENDADAREAVIDQMEARIEDLKNHIGLQRGLIQQLLGQPEKQPTRDDLIEALATARARLEAHDGETARLREMVSQLRETVALLGSQNQIAITALKTLTQRAEFKPGPPPDATTDLGPSHDTSETLNEASNASVVRSPGE